MGDLPAGRPLPTQNNTDTEKKQTYIHFPTGIRTQDPNMCLKEHGHCERHPIT
jgi:hypothetical protein